MKAEAAPHVPPVEAETDADARTDAADGLTAWKEATWPWEREEPRRWEEEEAAAAPRAMGDLRRRCFRTSCQAIHGNEGTAGRQTPPIDIRRPPYRSGIDPPSTESQCIGFAQRG
jgi:hypothetical protein